MNKVQVMIAAGMAVMLSTSTGALAFAAASNASDVVGNPAVLSLAAESDELDLANLADGVYGIPVSLTSASEVDSSTMPSVFLKPEASLYVSGAERKIVVTLQTASIMGANYNADGLYFYPEGTFSVNSGIMTVSPGAVAASQTLTFIEDPADKYHHYPEKILGDFPASAMTNGGYIAVTMGSSVMSSSLLCLKCDLSGMKSISTEAPEMPTAAPADKAVLDEEIAKAQDVQQIEGRELAYQELQDALERARSLSQDSSATQQNVDAAAKELHSQSDAYRKMDLRSLYNDAASVDLGKYTAQTRSELSRQLSASKAVLDNPDAEDASIADAYAALKSAYDGLELASVDKTALGAKIDEASAAEQGKKTDQAFRSLQNAISAAQTVYGDDEATQSQVNDALVNLTNALKSFSESADKADDPASDNALEPHMLYETTGAWFRQDDPSAQSMMGDYFEPSVEVRVADDGYEVRITPTSQGDALIDAVYFYQGEDASRAKADVVSPAGVTPHTYRLNVDEIDEPLLIGVDARMGSETATSVRALLVLDKAGMRKVDPTLKAGVSYKVPVALYESNTYMTDNQRLSTVDEYHAADAVVSHAGGSYKAEITLAPGDGAKLRRVIYGEGENRATASVSEASDGSAVYTLALGTLTGVVPVGFTFDFETRYADLVFETATVDAIAASPGGNPPAGPGETPGGSNTGSDDVPKVDPPKDDPAKDDDPKDDEPKDDPSGGDDSKDDEPKDDEPKDDPSKGGDEPVVVQTRTMYRLYNPNNGEHFYTSDDAERDALVSVGWGLEGKGWTAPEESDIPVFRMYNPVAGEHHYTSNALERDALIEAGWDYEGIGWYSSDEGGVPLYRDYNPNAYSNNHNYTADESEHEWLLSLGWRPEGIGWYGL